MGSTTISQISCFSSINRELNLNRRKRFTMVAPFRTKFSVSMKLEGSGTETPSAKTNTTLKYASDASKLPGEEAVESYPTTEEPVAGSSEADVQVHEDGVTEPIKAAKIHDFCFGIPFGALVLSGGFVGFLFSRNPSTLGFGMLYGGALLALSTFSLKVWRQRKSSLPFILGQAALAAALLWKHVQNYSLTKKIFPAGFYAVVSAAMVCFYSYVILSGGNPPPKKKLQASPPSPNSGQRRDVIRLKKEVRQSLAQQASRS